MTAIYYLRDNFKRGARTITQYRAMWLHYRLKSAIIL